MLLGFRSPALLALIPLVLGGGYALLRCSEARREVLLSLIGCHQTEARSKHRIIAPLMLLLIGLVALARPYTGYRDIEIPSVGGDIMVVLDVSLSMQASDAAPTRLEAAKRKVLDLADWLRLHYPGTQMGITLFAGSAHLYCPLTADYDVIRQFTQAIQSSFVTRGGSGLATAMRETIRTLEEAGSPSPVILVLSDGEDRSFDEKRINPKTGTIAPVVIALGFGSSEGVPIPVDGGRFLRDRSGNIVISRRNDDTLTRIAETFRGRYQVARPTDDDFAPFLSETFGISATTTENAGRSPAPTQSIRVYDEIGPFLALFTLAGLILLTIAGRHRALAAVVLCLLPMVAHADEPAVVGPPTVAEPTDPTARDAYHAYVEGRYEAAAEGFRSARRKDPTNLDLLQAEASAAFRLKQFSIAERLFSELARKSSRSTQRFEARYNRGNALLGDRHFEKAIQSYDEALSLKPGDPPTIANKGLAQQLLLQQQQQQQQKNNERSQTEQEKHKNQSQQQANQSPDHPSDKGEQEDTKEQKPSDQESEDTQSSDHSQKQEQPQRPENSPSPESRDNEDNRDVSEKSPRNDQGQNSEDQDPNADTRPTPAAERTPESSSVPDRGDQSPTKGVPEENSPSKGKSPQEEQPLPHADGDDGDDGASSSDSHTEDTPKQSSNKAAGSSAQDEQQETLPATEAERWLSSLPDAPVLLRRFQKNDEPPSEQQW